ncbi:MAG: glycosyltransferase family A protein, partial [Phycisphaerae bacterium]
MKCPTVSVTMTVYNAGSYLEVAVGSILAQTYTDFEFVIIDDGSTDDSLRRLERFAACDDRVHLVSRPNTGISRARNDALSLARGQFVAVMDADDVAHPERLEREVSYLQN